MIREITEVLNLRAGESLVYHMGYLPVDRDTRNLSGDEKRLALNVSETALTALSMSDKGLVHLLQRRIPESMVMLFCRQNKKLMPVYDYEYLAVKRATV